MDEVFSRIISVDFPANVRIGRNGFLPAGECVIRADGAMPFPQVICRDAHGSELFLVKGDAIVRRNDGEYVATLPGDTLRPGKYVFQIEGCKRVDFENAAPGDWVKTFQEYEVPASPADAVPEVRRVDVGDAPKLYFGIHKHMHQPYYRAAEPEFWDGGSDEIFSVRAGAYRHFIRMAVEQYGPLHHAGLSMSWSGSLLEQLDRCSRQGLAHGAYSGDWKAELAGATRMHTVSGHPRADFTAFGFFHPLMPLIPARDIKAHIVRHRKFIQREFGVSPSTILFPPETAFHVRMIPALLEAGVTGVIYDSIHRYRACRDYPYAGKEEGMLPPNPAEQENPCVADWLQLRNVWAGSKIAPGLLRPEYIKYVGVNGDEHRIVGVPAERYIGNEDARGGFGALVYPDVLGQVLDAVVRSGSYDPAHPPFFLLHSDGDNYGGGTDSYYGSNTSGMVEWLKNDPRFELTSIQDYLDRFPPDPATAVHLEPGAWSGADNGDPQFMKWFSGYNNPYSPDLNSWAVLTALQNAVHTMLDVGGGDGRTEAAERLLLTAETSCYWYWTGQDIWDGQVTAAANAAMDLIGSGLDAAVKAGGDVTGPTIFPPWVTPENPGGRAWGNNGLVDAGRIGTVHTFIHDVSGIASVRLFLRMDAGTGRVQEVPLVNCGPYPSRTGARVVATLFRAELPEGAGDVRYWIEAEDGNGNLSRSALERVYLA